MRIYLVVNNVNGKLYVGQWTNGIYPRTGKRASLETIKKMSVSHRGLKQSKEQIKKRSFRLMKPIQCLTTGKVYDSILSASTDTGINYKTVSRLVRTGKKNKSGLGFRFIGRITCAS